MELLINLLLVLSPYLGVILIGSLLYAVYGRKFIKIKAFVTVIGFITTLGVVKLITSPLIRPTTTHDIDQGLVYQLESEANEVVDVEDLILEDKTKVKEVKTKYEKYEPSL